MKITKHFSYEEMHCNDGTVYPMILLSRLSALCYALEVVRAVTGLTLTLNSVYRTSTYNKRIGGARNSQHKLGMAADFKLKGISPKRLFPILDRFQRLGVLPKGGLHAYSTFVHLDTRGRIKRW